MEIKSYFSKKRNMSSKIMLEKDKIMRKDKNVAEIMNNYFNNIIETANLKSSKISNSNDIMELTFLFHDHVSIKKIIENCSQIIPDAFTFSPVSFGDVQKETMYLDVKKSSSSKSILATISKQFILLTFFR